MTRLGFYIVHNSKRKMVHWIDVPWTFEFNKPDNPIPDTSINIGEWEDPEEGIMPIVDNAEGDVELPPDDEEEEIIPTFGEWFKEYYEKNLVHDEKFLLHFNNDFTYIIISAEDEMVMGLFRIGKGYTYMNFDEFDYRILINNKFLDIRKDMNVPDESFGGFDEDKDFTLNENNKNNKHHHHHKPCKPNRPPKGQYF